MVKLINKKVRTYFTIDFECLTFDLCRMAGTRFAPRSRKQYLSESIDNLETLIRLNTNSDPKITFFCTGVTADLYPELIEKIAEKGHEIACHGDFHDDLNKMKLSDVYASLHAAKRKLKSLTGKDILGFRAPRFSVSKYDYDRLAVIAELFRYDSSLHFNSIEDFRKWEHSCPVQLIEFPVPEQYLVGDFLRVKLGGSFLKLFPCTLVESAAYKSSQNGLSPIFYLHPYDLYFGYNLLITWQELDGAQQRLYWYARQLQWAGVFNWKQKKKLMRLFRNFENIGPLGKIVPSFKYNKM